MQLVDRGGGRGDGGFDSLGEAGGLALGGEPLDLGQQRVERADAQDPGRRLQLVSRRRQAISPAPATSTAKGIGPNTPNWETRKSTISPG